MAVASNEEGKKVIQASLAVSCICFSDSTLQGPAITKVFKSVFTQSFKSFGFMFVVIIF